MELQQLHNKHVTAFTELINRTHESSEYAAKAMVYLPYLKSLSSQHMQALSTFKKMSHDSIEFPALHRELFAVADSVTSWSHSLYVCLLVWHWLYPGQLTIFCPYSHWPSIYQESCSPAQYLHPSIRYTQVQCRVCIYYYSCITWTLSVTFHFIFISCSVMLLVYLQKLICVNLFNLISIPFCMPISFLSCIITSLHLLFVFYKLDWSCPLHQSIVDSRSSTHVYCWLLVLLGSSTFSWRLAGASFI